MSQITYIKNSKSWIESIAVEQIEHVGSLPNVTSIVALPDLHAGKVPIGMVAKVDGGIYPHLIGNDIGCGMSLFQTGISMKHYKQEKWLKQLKTFDLSQSPTINPYPEDCPISDLGTLGGGNHFAEFQALEQVFLEKEIDSLGIGKKEILLLIHSGSRGYGQSIFSEFSMSYRILLEKSPQFQAYLRYHQDALLWAQRNRFQAAKTIINQLGFSKDITTIVDCVHNFVEKDNHCYLHRKGAVSTKNGLVIVPGSRGSLTYLVKPTENCDISLYSLSHGAGRKYQRSRCRSRMLEKYAKNDLKSTALGSRVICRDSILYYEEAPDIYKNIDQIIECLKEYQLIQVVATLKPLLTYKG